MMLPAFEVYGYAHIGGLDRRRLPYISFGPNRQCWPCFCGWKQQGGEWWGPRAKSNSAYSWVQSWT